MCVCVCVCVQVLGLLYPLLSHVDPDLSRHLQAHSLPPFFALSWLITWFSHDLTNVQVRGGGVGDGIRRGWAERRHQLADISRDGSGRPQQRRCWLRGPSSRACD